MSSSCGVHTPNYAKQIPHSHIKGACAYDVCIVRGITKTKLAAMRHCQRETVKEPKQFNDIICTCPSRNLSGLLLLYPFLFAANRFGAVEEGGMDGWKKEQSAGLRREGEGGLS